MKLPSLPYTSVHWDALPATEHQGETGKALWRTLNNGDVRMRVVELSPGYLADHWCDRGHIVYVLEGEVTSELKDGRSFIMKQGMGYTVSDFGDAAHRSWTKDGARLFIVDYGSRSEKDRRLPLVLNSRSGGHGILNPWLSVPYRPQATG